MAIPINRNTLEKCLYPGKDAVQYLSLVPNVQVENEGNCIVIGIQLQKVNGVKGRESLEK